MCGLEGAGGYVQECGTAFIALEVQGAEPVVFLLLEHAVGEGYAGGEDLGDAALYQFGGELGVFQLVADGHLVPRADEPRKILLYGVMRHSGHGYVSLPAV